ncbi:putative bifunctional diguanylate cyclase/phosphodiesterase [Cryptosporangium phraense]|uniref:EAL domain-containing protein n=1 Tax=Cryptosporangium phraense TaxID=2593070 RepID=A0A545AKH7_9ACTN|nr:EAL domain-containing protein [Cryptosporangium phraense]TQS41799.1 EAL domain-containing protein [Cryptosporangium phraense]
MTASFWQRVPRGRPPGDPTWASRHRTIVVVLVGHVVGLPIYGWIRDIPFAQCMFSVAPLVLLTALAASDHLPRRLRAVAATLGTVVSSAVVVSFSGGYIEAHFHFFVMLFVIMLYQDWLTFFLAIAFVGVEHAVVGVLTPGDVYGEHTHQAADPVKFALIHAAYVGAAALAAIGNWRLTDRAQAATEEIAEQLEFEVSHDPLTGALNRREFETRITDVLTRVEETDANVVCVLDLDRFKIVNDTCGHPAGDRLLVEVCEVLKNVLAPGDTLARLGGDEFGILVERPTVEEAVALAEAACAALAAHRYKADGRTFAASASIGVLPLFGQVRYVEEVMQLADAALYGAKEAGRGRVHVHQQGDVELNRRQSDSIWAGALLDALHEDRLELVYQPIVPTAQPEAQTGGRIGEILVRLREADGSLISPGLFFPAAERYDLLPALDRQVVAKAISMIAAHYRPGEPTNDDLYTINLAGPSIGDETFRTFVQTQLDEHKLSPSLICFEITETVAITNLGVARRFITELRSTGCRFALDDFGSGLSSFAYLKNLPVDFLKIDGNFVKTITHDSIDRTMVAAVNKIGHEMGLRTVAEFVEDDETLAILREIGVDYGQGYGLGRPGPLTSWLTDRRPPTGSPSRSAGTTAAVA